jgi:hypothetical protein
MNTSDPTVSTVPASAVLDNWANAEWTDGCQVDAVAVFQTLTVATHNTFYEIVVLNGHQGWIRIRGGQFFPDWREVQLSGASLGGSFLKLRGIYAGFCMELRAGDETIITSPVRRLTMTHLDGTRPH